jgi:hypothetical protein
MNRSIAILTVCIVLFSSAKAQVSFGAKAGGALTSLPGFYSNDSKIGMYGGIAAGIPLTKLISLQAELYYSQQGNKLEVMLTDQGGNDLGKATLTYRLNYINLPVMVRCLLPKGFFAETGLQAGLLVNAKVKGSGGSTDIKDSYESFDLSLPVGIGYQLQNGLGANLRYNAGLTNVLKTDFHKPHNSFLQLGLFYNLKKH